MDRISEHPDLAPGLRPVVAAAEAYLASRKVVCAESLLRVEAENRAPARPWREALTRPGLAIIAEYKRHSPSAGWINTRKLDQMLPAYRLGGADAISVLTDAPSFAGSIDDLREAHRCTDLPVLRKDVIFDRYQVVEARAAGADAILLIAAVLPPEKLRELHDEARIWGLETLVEAHNRSELERAIEVGPDTLGINARDLADFSEHPDRVLELLPEVSNDVTVVAESGISSRAKMEDLEAAGVDAVLIGSALMRADDPAAKLRELRGVGI